MDTTVTGTTQSRFVIDDRDTPRFRVHRRAMVDQAVLDDERARVFDTSWLYVGHESELRAPHDFRTRKVGGRPIIFTRNTDNTVKVFLNTCPHRGMQIETRPEGTGRFLKCFYHGWSFNTAGELVALPDEASYGPDFDRHNLCLARPSKVDSYRGFVFLSWSTDVPDLLDYLGGATEYIDIVADQAEDDEMQVIGGTHLYSMRANWKLLVENSYDGYHALTTHHRYLQMLKDSGADMSRSMGGGGPALGHDLGHGHAVIGGYDTSGGRALGLGRAFPTESAERKQLERRARLAARYGEDWINRMYAGRNLIIFPNLVIVDLVMGCTIRTFFPENPDYMEITAWQIQPPNEDPELHDMRMSNFLTFWGPAGLATPDDVEALERCQKGFAGHGAAPWSDISRGMIRERPIITDELQMRVWWREWDRRMTGTQHPLEVPRYVANGRGPLKLGTFA